MKKRRSRSPNQFVPRSGEEIVRRVERKGWQVGPEEYEYIITDPETGKTIKHGEARRRGDPEKARRDAKKFK